MLAALGDTRFSLLRVSGRHPEAGIWLEDLLRGGIFDLFTDGGADDDLAPLADEPLFAQSVYQLALELGLTASVSYR